MFHRQREDHLRSHLALAGLILVTTVARLGLGFRYFGFSSGDDVEILEEGFRRALDLEYTPLPIRSLLLSDLLVAPVLGVASALGITETSTLLWLASLPFVALASLNVALVFAIGRQWFDDWQTALLAATLYALHWIPLGYGSTVYPRTATTTCLLLALWLLGGSGRRFWRCAAAGALAALAFTFRSSEGVIVLPLIAWLVWRERSWAARGRELFWLGSGFVLTTLLTLGVYDWITWSKPFSSLLELVDYVLVRGKTPAPRAVQPWFWYGWRLPKWLPVTLLPLLAVAARCSKGRRALVLGLLPLLLLSGVRLKGLRYLHAVIPFVSLAAAYGARLWWQKGRRRTTAVLVIVSAVLSLGGLSFLQKKSMAAVEAARFMAADPEVECVALAQFWAYGDLLFFRPGVEVRALPLEPSVAEIERLAPGCDRVALYSDHLVGAPELELTLERLGFSEVREFRWGRGRDVRVFGTEPSRSLP